MVEKIDYWEERPILINICLKAVFVYFHLSSGINNCAYLIGILVKKQVALILMLICIAFAASPNQLFKKTPTEYRNKFSNL